MNRVIKFRAWDEAEKWMGEVSSIDFDEGYLFLTTRNSDDENRFDLHTIPLMQFTGLYDKNGKEIYEGDILKHPVGIVATVKYVPEHAAFLAYYSMEGSFKYDYLEGDGRMKNCEVIGNIHQHPELLVVAQ